MEKPNGQQVLLKLRCLLLCFPETRSFYLWNRAQLNECVKLYHFETNERCHTLEELFIVVKLTCNNTAWAGILVLIY